MNVTIVGGGFGGVKTALELAKDHKNHITLISDKEDFQYYPALYSSATGHSHLESWIPLGEIFAGKENVHVQMDSIETIDADRKVLTGASGVEYRYTTAVLALGSATTFFGIKGLDTYAYGIKSAEEIRRLKQHLYHDIAEHGMVDKEYIIVGGGPTGVELASALGQYIKRLCKKYHVRHHTVRIRLVEAAPRLVPKMAESTSARIEKRLKKLGIDVQTGRTVEAASSDHLMINGQAIETKTVIWTSGVATSPFYENNDRWFTFAKNRKIVVDQYLSARPNVYVIGDNAATPYSGLALTAVRDGVFLAKNLQRQAHGKKMKPYTSPPPAVVVPVGAWWAAFEWRSIRLYGVIASLIRRAADVVGYDDILPLSQAISKARAGTLIEDDYFPPSHPPGQAH